MRKRRLFAILLACLMVFTVSVPAFAASRALRNQANYLTGRGHNAVIFHPWDSEFATVNDTSVTYNNMVNVLWDIGGRYYLPRENARIIFGNNALRDASTAIRERTEYVRLRDVAESASYAVFYRDGFVVCIQDNTSGSSPTTPGIIEVGAFPRNAQEWRNWVDTKYSSITITGDDGHGNNYRDHSARNGTHVHDADNLWGGEWIFARNNISVDISRYQGLLISNGDAFLIHYAERASDRETFRVPAGTFYRVMNSNDMGGPRGAIGCAVEAAFRISERNGFMTNVTVRIFGNGVEVGRVAFRN